MTLTLEEHCNVLLAADGLEALETLGSRAVDVVLLDLVMPGMDGRQALVQMRHHHPRTPVIMVTAVDDLPTIVQCVKLGAWSYVTKPWDEAMLVDLVHGAAREGCADEAVLLVSDGVASLVPLQLALEPQTRVLAMNIAQALRCQVLPTAIVVECPANWMRAPVRDLQERFPKTRVIVTNSLDGAMEELARLGAITHATRLHPAVTAAIKFMVAHYDEPLTVREIAEAANLSEGRLAHIFRDTTGFPVKDYVTRFRVSIARRLLVETTDTLDTIAARTGYADVSSFSRMFKSIDGISPGEFRRRRPVG
jgi:YesN/AraC family two-component response regulator